MTRTDKSDLETLLLQCTECGNEEANVVVDQKGHVGIFCARCFEPMGSFGIDAEFDELYDIVKEDREEYAKKHQAVVRRES